MPVVDDPVVAASVDSHHRSGSAVGSLAGRLRAVEASLSALSDDLVPERVAGREVAEVVRVLRRIERRAGGARLVLTSALAETGLWRTEGFASPEEWVARADGTTVGAAKADLAASKQLGALPVAREAVAKGEVSAEAARAAAEGATADPGVESDLVAKAKTGDLRSVRDGARRARQRRDEREGGRAAVRHYQRRALRSWLELDGEGRGTWNVPASYQAAFLAALEPYRQEAFKAAREAGRRESHEALMADALYMLARDVLADHDLPEPTPGPDADPGTGAEGPSAGAASSGGPTGPGTAGRGTRGDGRPTSPGGDRAESTPPAPPAGSGTLFDTATEPRTVADEASRPETTPDTAVTAHTAEATGRETTTPPPGPPDPPDATTTDHDPGRAPRPETTTDPPGPPGRHRSPDIDADARRPRSSDGGQPSGRRARRRRPPAQVHVHVDYDALLRGYTKAGETCEVEGLGPVPVAFARFLANDAVLHVVFTGTDVTVVSSARRYVPAAVRRALEARDRTCVVPGCNRSHHLEMDHWTHDFAQGCPTSLATLARLCRFHHHLKTHAGWTLTGGPGAWQFHPPGHGPPDGPDPPDGPGRSEDPDQPP